MREDAEKKEEEAKQLQQDAAGGVDSKDAQEMNETEVQSGFRDLSQLYRQSFRSHCLFSFVL